MPEKCKLYNLESFTDEERQRVEDLINQIEEEKKAQKWWIMPDFDSFDEQYNPSIKLNYFVEEQKDSYSRSRPPLKSDFESKEAAEKWLKEYLKEDDLFKEAIREITKLINNIGSLVQKFKNHQYINNTDILNCFNSFHISCRYGSLSKVIKE